MGDLERFRFIQDYNHRAYLSRTKLEEKAVDAFTDGDVETFQALLKKIDEVTYLPYSGPKGSGPELPAWIMGATPISREERLRNSERRKDAGKS